MEKEILTKMKEVACIAREAADDDDRFQILARTPMRKLFKIN
jgi:hypothetical protein